MPGRMMKSSQMPNDPPTNQSKQTFSSSRSSSSLGGFQSKYLVNDLTQEPEPTPLSGQPNTNCRLSRSSLNGSNSELTRRSTIGSSKETVQERILRKSFYQRFQSPDRMPIDNSHRARRKSALTDYLEDDYLNDSSSGSRRSRRKSISKSIGHLEEDEDSLPNGRRLPSNQSSSNDLRVTSDEFRKRPGHSRTRTSHSPYRVLQDEENDLSDEELLSSLSSINRRNSFAYGSSSITRYPSLQASFERNLSSKFAGSNDLDDGLHNEATKKAGLMSYSSKRNDIGKRNSIAAVDYDNNNNLFRNSLHSLRTKLSESNGRSGLESENLLKTDPLNKRNSRRPGDIELST